MKTLPTVLLIGSAACGLLCAQNAKTADGAKGNAPATAPRPSATLGDKIVVTKTESVDFPTAGLLHMPNAIGIVTITGWDEAKLEMTTIKSTKTAVDPKDHDQAAKLIDNVKIATEGKGGEVTVATSYPKHSKLARPFVGMTDFDLEYRIHVPRAARLDIGEAEGEINIEDIHGDLHVIEGLGQINVRVPEGSYSIDARVKTGAVNSDFAGNDRTLKLWFIPRPGQAFMASAANSAQKMFLRVSYGDVVILKMH